MRKKATNWADVYRSDESVENKDLYMRIHSDFLKSIEKERPRKLLEAGCGSGIFSIELSQRGYTCVGIDNNQGILDIATKNNRVLGGKAQFQFGDLSKIPFPDQHFDVVFSQGVLEHYSDETIRHFLSEQVRVGKRVVFSVPHLFYGHKDIGDERLLTESKWKRILRPFNMIESQPYYAIRRKRTAYLKLPQMYLAKIGL